MIVTAQPCTRPERPVVEGSAHFRHAETRVRGHGRDLRGDRRGRRRPRARARRGRARRSPPSGTSGDARPSSRRATTAVCDMVDVLRRRARRAGRPRGRGARRRRPGPRAGRFRPRARERATRRTVSIRSASPRSSATTDVVALLLERDADVTQRARNPLSVMALHSAAATNQTAIAQRPARRRRRRRTRRSRSGYTPLHAAAANGNMELVDAAARARSRPVCASRRRPHGRRSRRGEGPRRARRTPAGRPSGRLRSTNRVTVLRRRAAFSRRARRCAGRAPPRA